jgi:hypothetical protein
VPIPRYPELLNRSPHADEQDVGLGGVDPRNDRVGLGAVLREETVVGAGAREARISVGKNAHRSFTDMLAATEPVDACTRISEVMRQVPDEICAGHPLWEQITIEACCEAHALAIAVHKIGTTQRVHERHLALSGVEDVHVRVHHGQPPLLANRCNHAIAQLAPGDRIDPDAEDFDHYVHGTLTSVPAMKVAFILNYERTKVFFALSKHLEAAGHEVFFISPGTHWARWLEKEGVATSRILDVAASGTEWERDGVTPEEVEHLANLERASAIHVNDVIMMDRILRHAPADRVRAYFAVASRCIQAFLLDRDIQLVFGEQTFAFEILTTMVCKTIKRTILNPHVVRIPVNRLGFFRGHLTNDLVRFRDVTPAHHAQAQEVLADFRRNKPIPDFVKRNKRPPMPRANWPAKLVKHVRIEIEDPHDETHFSPAWLMKQRGKEVLYGLAHRVASPFWTPPSRPERPFVLYPMQRQPESSIDVLGSRFTNQIELIRTIARTVPSTHDLYVKEHPLGAGDRSPRVFRELRAIPGVKLVDPDVDSFALADAADLVISVSGTATIESAFRGRPAATIGDMFFGPLLVANAWNPYVGSVSDLLRIREVASDEKILAFLANVLAQSYVGTLGNPLHFPKALEPENIASVAIGFLDLLAAQR